NLGQVGLTHDRYSRRTDQFKPFLLSIVGVDDRHILGLPVERPILDVPAADHTDPRRVKGVNIIDPVAQIFSVTGRLICRKCIGYFSHLSTLAVEIHFKCTGRVTDAASTLETALSSGVTIGGGS